MPRKIVFFMSCGIGTESADAYLVPKNVLDNDITEYAYKLAVNHAESYGIYSPEDDEGFCYDFDNIESWWEIYDSKKHDGKLLRGCAKEVSWKVY